MSDMPERDHRTHAEGEPLSPWEQIKRSFSDAVEQGKTKYQRQQVLNAELRKLSLVGVEMRQNDIEQEIIDLFHRKHVSEGEDDSLDVAIEDVMDDWRTVRADVIRRRS